MLKHKRSSFAWILTLWILVFCLETNLSLAQCIPSPVTTTIINSSNTVVNTYYPGNTGVSAGSKNITVGTKRGTTPDIADGDLVLIIQMQGVEINTTLPDNLVDILGITGDYGDGDGGYDRRGFINNTHYIAGKYEYAIAAGPVSGGILSLRTALINSYTHNLSITSTLGSRTFQIVRVANYQDLILSSAASITALAWNGRTGGIIAIDVNNNFILDGSINANAMGFRGGARYANEVVYSQYGHRGEGIAGTPRIVYTGSQILNNLSSQGTSNFTGTYAGVSTYPGILSGIFDTDRGLGSPANAGGAGFEDTGGGGGSNGGIGGSGSQDTTLLQDGTSKGAQSMDALGGERLFMGGGGGSGGRDNDSGDNDAASSGQAGGGIIIIRANYILGSGTITSNGGGGYFQFSEGTGGGGAGGTILMSTYSSDLSGLSIQAKGGNGNGVLLAGDGGGGGGGGGTVLLNRIGGTFTALPTINTQGGAAGISGSGTTAAVGGTGGFSVFSLPGNSFMCSLSALPITLLNFEASLTQGNQVDLRWTTTQEINNAFFVIERSKNGIDFEEIIKLDGTGNSIVLRNYQFLDVNPYSGINYYRLKQVDFDGNYTHSRILALKVDIPDEIFKVYPNPAQHYIKITTSNPIEAIRLWSITRQLIFEKYERNNALESTLDISKLSKGVYFIEILSQQRRYFKKIMLE